MRDFREFKMVLILPSRLFDWILPTFDNHLYMMAFQDHLKISHHCPFSLSLWFPSFLPCLHTVYYSILGFDLWQAISLSHS